MAKRRNYDHRIKEAIIYSRNPNLFPHLNIPRSTAKSWIRRGMTEIVTDESFNMNQYAMAIDFLKVEVKKTKSLLNLTSLVHAFQQAHSYI